MDIEDREEGSGSFPDPLHSSKYCLSHAKHRINELIGVINSFAETNPCKSFIEIDANTGESVLKVKLTKPMPVDVPGIVFDALNCLRSALDHAGYAVCIAARINGQNAHFPFGDTVGEVIGRAKGNGRSRDIPQEIFNAMVDCKPYLCGNNTLWALNRLCNRNKHDFIIPYAVASPVFAWSISNNFQSVRASQRKWDRAKNEMEVARAVPGVKFQDNINFSAYVIFEEMEVVGLRPVDNVLNEMLEAVCASLSTISKEAYRLGLFK